MVPEIKTDMAFLALLLNSGLLFLGAYAVDNSWREDSSIGVNYHLPDYVIPTFYDIQLSIHTENDNASTFNFFGKVNIKIKVLHSTRNISLHAHPYILIRKTMLMKEVFNTTVYEPIEYKYHDKTHILTFYFKSTLLIGNYILDIKFESISNNTEVFYKTSYMDEKEDKGWLVISHFKAIGARRLFPCWDEPHLKAVFRIAIYHHKNYKAQSNMPLHKLLSSKNDMKWSVFHPTPVMSTYLVAVMISDYDGNPYIKKSANIWCRKLMRQDIEYAGNVAKNIKHYFDNASEFKSLKKKPRVKHIIIPGFQEDCMENWRLIFYREIDVIYREEIDHITRKIEITRLVARKMAHQWFGNMVSPSLWSYLWLNDGIATLLGMDAINKIFPSFLMFPMFVVQNQHESLHLDTNLIIKSLTSKINNPSEINSLSFSRYIKAPVMLHMLQHILTTDVFREGLNIYLNNHMFQSTTPDDLWIAMQTALDKSPYKAYTFNVSQIMAGWLKGISYPVINVLKNNHKHVIVWLEKSYINEPRWIPITITTQTKPNFYKNFLPHGQWIESPNFTYCNFLLPYEEKGWIIANLRQIGYYRVNYDLKNWQKIVNYLNSPKYLKIHVLNRAQIIDDAFHFMIEGKIYPAIFWKLANYLCHEKDYIAWYPMIKAFERMSSVFSLPEIKTVWIRNKMLYILDNIIEIKYEEDHDDISDQMKCLREEIAKWECILELPQCIRIAQEVLEQTLRNPDRNTIAPWWKGWTYRNGMKDISDTTWTRMLHLWQKTHDIEILKALTCTKNFTTIHTFLLLIKQEISLLNLSLRDRINIYFSIVEKHVRKNQFLDEILNFEKVKPRKISTTATLTYIINHANSKEHFDKINTYVNNNVKQLISYVQRKITIRQSQIKHQINYLHIIQKPMEN